MKNKKLLITAAIFVAILLVYIKGCVYLPISGTVVDAETGKPIEGAVVLAEWTLTRGAWIGLSTTETYKVEETLTDKDGRFKINSYVIRPFINKPSLTIYKAGYVCWNNEYIFPGNKHMNNFMWKTGNKYELGIFRKEYSYSDHVSFISRSIPSLDARDLFEKAYEWERLLSLKELRERNKNR